MKFTACTGNIRQSLKVPCVSHMYFNFTPDQVSKVYLCNYTEVCII